MAGREHEADEPERADDGEARAGPEPGHVLRADECEVVAVGDLVAVPQHGDLACRRRDEVDRMRESPADGAAGPVARHARGIERPAGVAFGEPLRVAFLELGHVAQSLGTPGEAGRERIVAEVEIQSGVAARQHEAAAVPTVPRDHRKEGDERAAEEDRGESPRGRLRHAAIDRGIGGESEQREQPLADADHRDAEDDARGRHETWIALRPGAQEPIEAEQAAEDEERRLRERDLLEDHRPIGREQHARDQADPAREEPRADHGDEPGAHAAEQDLDDPRRPR